VRGIGIQCGGETLLLSWQQRRQRPRLLLGARLSHSREEAVQVDRRALKGQAPLLRLACGPNQAQGLRSLQDQTCLCCVEEVQEVEAATCTHAHPHLVDLLTLVEDLPLEQCCQHSQVMVAYLCQASGSTLFATTQDCCLSSGRASCLS
jgi:hypothetical protein